MKERLLIFLFFGILLAFAYNFALDKVHHAFSTVLWFQAYWVIPYVVVPALLLLGLAWWTGFYRRTSARWADALATLMAAGMIYLNLGAGYACWQYCF